MQKDGGIQKSKKNPSEPEPDRLKPKAIECKKALELKKQTKINPSKPKPDGPKPKAMKCKKTLKVKKQKQKFIGP